MTVHKDPGSLTGPRGHRRTARARIAAAALAAAVLLPCVSVVSQAAPGTSPDIRIAFAKDAYWYQPAAGVKMTVTLDNRSRQTVRGVDVRLRVHARNTTRSDLDACFEGKPPKVYRQTETLARGLALTPGNNTSQFEFVLDEGYGDGVYPVTLEALREGDVLSSAISEMIIFSPPEDSEMQPLRLALVFEVLEPPHRAPDGLFRNDELAGECDPTGDDPGWYTNFGWMNEKWPGIAASFTLSPMLFSEIDDMTDGYIVREGDKERRVRPDSRQASDASSLISAFRRLTQVPTFQMMAAPYASPDLESLIQVKWQADAREQITFGRKALEKYLDTTLGRQYNCPPALVTNTRVLRELGQDGGTDLVLSASLLERSRAGERLLSGDTLTQPVHISGSRRQKNTLGLVEDARMKALFQRVSASGDPHGVAQCLLSELTNLYLENPDEVRACVALWPGTWHPSRAVMDEVLEAISGAPWLKTATVAECTMTVPVIDNEPLAIPEPEAEPQEFPTEVSRARNNCEVFKGLAMDDNPLLPILQSDIWISESDVWREWDREVEGLTYATAVIEKVDEELGKIDMPPMGSISLTSAKAKIPLTIVNGTPYRLTATLRVASNGLSFPDGTTQQVRLEPKENLLEIPVTIEKKGRVRFQARLETQDYVLGEVDFTVLTSRFNYFAMALVGALLAVIAGVWVAKVASRRKVGKHKRRNLPSDGEGAAEPEG